MGKVKNLRKEAGALGIDPLPRFVPPAAAALADLYQGQMPWDIAQSAECFDDLKALKPARRAWNALLSRQPKISAICLIRDNFIPLSIQHQFYIDEDSESLVLELMLEASERVVPESWPYSLKVAYLCMQDGYGSYGDALYLWVGQLQKGRRKGERSNILTNMAKALAVAQSPYEDD